MNFQVYVWYSNDGITRLRSRKDKGGTNCASTMAGLNLLWYCIFLITPLFLRLFLLEYVPNGTSVPYRNTGCPQRALKGHQAIWASLLQFQLSSISKLISMSICSNHISVLSFIPYVPLFTLGYSSGSLSQYISNNLYTFASNQTC